MSSRVRGRARDRSPTRLISGTIVFISSPRIRRCNSRCGSGDIYVTVKGVKRSGKVSRATIGRRLPWFRHPPINAPKQLSPNPDRTDLLRALHYLHKCNRRARVRCRGCKRAGKEMPPLTCVASCRLPSRCCREIECSIFADALDFFIVRLQTVVISATEIPQRGWDLFFSSESSTDCYYRCDFLIFHNRPFLQLNRGLYVRFLAWDPSYRARNAILLVTIHGHSRR